MLFIYLNWGTSQKAKNSVNTLGTKKINNKKKQNKWQPWAPISRSMTDQVQAVSSLSS